MDPESIKSCCASLCTVVSAVAVPVLVYIALLCGAGSRLIEIPQEKKLSAAVGCWVAASLYAISFKTIHFFADTPPLSLCRTTTKPAKRLSKLESTPKGISCILS